MAKLIVNKSITRTYVVYLYVSPTYVPSTDNIQYRYMHITVLYQPNLNI